MQYSQEDIKNVSSVVESIENGAISTLGLDKELFVTCSNEDSENEINPSLTTWTSLKMLV